MRSDLPRTVFILVFSILNCGIGFAQIIQLESENSYKKVFVETDNFGASYLDTLENAFPRVKVDSTKFSILNDLAYYWHTRNLNRAMDFTQQGLALTQSKKNRLWEGRFEITQAAILLRMEKLDSALTVLESAKNKVLEKDLAFLHTQLGYVFERKGELDKAADYALKSLDYGVKFNDNRAIALAYSDLSNLFWKQSKFTTGLKYGLKSLEVFEERGITDMDYDFTLYVVGNNYLALNEHQKAQSYYEHAIIIGERYGFYNNLSDVNISLVDLYAYLNKFEKAEAAGKNAVKYAELLENNFMVMRSWLSIGKCQNLEEKYDLAIESLTKSIAIASDDFGDEYYLSQAYESLGKAYAGNHEYQKAYDAFAKYDVLKSIIFTAEADYRTSLLRTEFDVADKEGTILSQENQLKRQQTKQTLITIIASLLLLLLILSYKAIQNNVRKNKLLRKQNEEKEFLLREIHHRVKNNLEIVSSLLALQSAQMEDSEALGLMEESQHRVHSMSMIHQKLYMGENLAAIEMKDYFENLSDYILDAYGEEGRIVIDVNMNLIELDIDMAIPIGLIVNELITNSLKYAFPDVRRGKITVGLKEDGDKLLLEVTDDGIGKLKKAQANETGFGTKLIALLTKQLDGKMILHTNKGTSVSIQFQLNKAA